MQRNLFSEFKRLWSRKATISLIAGLIIGFIFLQGCTDTTNRVVLFFEKQAVQKAAQRYLEAEVKRDHKQIYGSLAPSSPYCVNNNYQMYLAEAERSAERIASYKIVRISNVRDNSDRKQYPKIDKFAQVEVDIVFSIDGMKQKMEVNYDFPFVKEGGKWYKG